MAIKTWQVLDNYTKEVLDCIQMTDAQADRYMDAHGMDRYLEEVPEQETDLQLDSDFEIN